MSDIDLSLVIACYNEKSILEKSIKQIFEVLDDTRFNYEVIFVDDKSEDNTRAIIDSIISKYPDKNLSKIFHEKNVGRGASVAEGIVVSRGPIVGSIDIDLSTPARYIPVLTVEIEKGADIANAFRVYKLCWIAVPRWIISKCYSFLVKLMLRLDLGDTETGCKLFRRERILPILDEIRDKHWFWDTEIIARAHIKGLRIVNLPTVFIRKGLYSRVKIIRDSFRYLNNLIRFKIELDRIRKR
ncbi:glycosyltransferase family 2 protein [Candidatus Omnitrophota bacterium]